MGSAASFSNVYIYDLGLDYFTRYPARVDSVTADQAQAVAQKYLVPGRLIVIAVGDRAKIEPELRKLNLGTVETWTPDGVVPGRACYSSSNAFSEVSARSQPYRMTS